MTDQPPDDHSLELHGLSELTSAQDEAVRRLLASARVTDPMPADVVARLDRVLTELTPPMETSETSPDTGQVIDLAARRRVRFRNLLVAAAAVVAVGITAPQLLPGLGPDSMSTSKSSADKLQAGDSEADAATAPEPATASEGTLAQSPGLRAVVREDHFIGDARRARGAVGRSGGTQQDFDAASCLGPGPGKRRLAKASEVVIVTFEDRPAALVFAKPSSGQQRVRLYLCGDPLPRLSGLLPVS
jgi:hypothetical protein